MILFYGEGRLGNQVFQYQALNHIAAHKERIVAIGLEDLAAAFKLCGARVRVLTHNGWIKRAVKYLLVPAVLRPLAKYLRILTYVYEPLSDDVLHAGLSGECRLQRGIFKHLTFVDGGSYQNSQFTAVMFPTTSLQLHTELRAKAQHFILDNTPVGSLPIFVHVRRGDYLHFSSYGVGDLALPEGFFRSALSEVKRRYNTAHFIFVTDDSKWVAQTFADIVDKSIVSFNPTLDFAIMAECSGAVLSNSTFSLAAALLLRNPAIVVGPRYWFGFRVKRWLPPRIRFDSPQLIYLPVVPEPQHS